MPGEAITVEVPRLIAMRRIDEPDPERRRRHVLGVGVAAGGIALVGVAVGLGAEARSKWGSVGTHCDATHLCDADGVSINHRARLYGNAATIVGGVGLAALIAGTVLYVTAPAARTRACRSASAGSFDPRRAAPAMTAAAWTADTRAWLPGRPDPDRHRRSQGGRPVRTATATSD
jgi:hypothetical protein